VSESKFESACEILLGKIILVENYPDPLIGLALPQGLFFKPEGFGHQAVGVHARAHAENLDLSRIKVSVKYSPMGKRLRIIAGAIGYDCDGRS
jgi:hypothetical protein